MRKFRTNFEDFKDACGYGLGNNYEKNNSNWCFETRMDKPIEDEWDKSQFHYLGTDGFWYNTKKCTEIL